MMPVTDKVISGMGWCLLCSDRLKVLEWLPILPFSMQQDYFIHGQKLTTKSDASILELPFAVQTFVEQKQS